MQTTYKKVGLLSVVVTSVLFGSFINAYAATFTLADIAPHNTASDCWVSVSGSVYDVTSFIPLHSGGQSIVIGACGTDATTIFNIGPHSSGTLNSLLPYKIGTLVASPVLTSVVLSPATSTILVGGTLQLVATPKDQNGSTTVASTTFASGNPSVATVNAAGMVTGVSAGTTTLTVTATNGTTTVSGTASVTVTAVPVGPVLTSVIVSPPVVIIKSMKKKQLKVISKDQFGAPISASTTFQTANPLIATVSATGRVRGVTSGTTTITVQVSRGPVTVTRTLMVIVRSRTSHNENEDSHGNGHENENEHDDDEDENHGEGGHGNGNGNNGNHGNNGKHEGRGNSVRED